MNKIHPLFLLQLFFMTFSLSDVYGQTYGLVIHGGAGTITEEGLSKPQQEAYEKGIQKALDASFEILDEGGSAQDAVVAAIRILEDDSNFNAGRGSVLNAEGMVEMDASIMTGDNLNAGAVAGVKTIRHPIEAAVMVMEDSPHVMMSNQGADKFAREKGLQTEAPSYFLTEQKKASLKKVQERAKEQGHIQGQTEGEWKYGTVGCVALDKTGNLAAGTSTGGMTNKLHNRIGDSPIIGAGTYANNRSCAVSCTGQGEFFIRLNIAHEVSALMMYEGYDVEKAASYTIHKELSGLGGQGGLIALDRRGNFSMPFNTPGMFRGYRMNDGRHAVLMFKDEK